MRSSSNSLSPTRMSYLMRYDWEINKRLYALSIAAVIALVVILYLVILHSTDGGLTLESGFAQGLFFTGFFGLCLLWTGNSFWSLRSNTKAKSYLLLPATNLEKYLSELLIKVVGLLVIYPFVFWIGSNLGIRLFQIFGPMSIADLELKYLGMLSFTEFWIIKDLGSQLTIVKLTVIGLIFIIPSLMWVGSLIFEKYNLLGMPLALFIVYLVLAGTSLGLSWMMNPATVTKNGRPTVEMLKFDRPEIFAETPLLLLMSAIWIWLAILLSYVVGYVKLTEKQV